MLRLVKLPIENNEIHIVELVYKEVFNKDSGILPEIGTVLTKSTFDYSELSDKIYKLTACVNESMRLPGELSVVLKKSDYILVDDTVLLEKLNEVKISGNPVQIIVDKRI